MNTSQANVLEFHEKFGCVINQLPTVPDLGTLLLRMKLIYEELTELAEACGFHKDPVPSFEDKWMVNVHSLNEKTPEKQLIDIADALADLLYVTYGTAVSCGMNMEPLMREVHRSNMSKVWPDGTVHLREDGKVLKSPEYSEADLGLILEAQEPLWRPNLLTVGGMQSADPPNEISDPAVPYGKFDMQLINSKGKVLGEMHLENKPINPPRHNLFCHCPTCREPKM